MSGAAESRQFLELLQEKAVPIIAPYILLPGSFTAISGQWERNPWRGICQQAGTLPHLVLVPFDTVLARQAVDVVPHIVARSDAVYWQWPYASGCAGNPGP